MTPSKRCVKPCYRMQERDQISMPWKELAMEMGKFQEAFDLRFVAGNLLMTQFGYCLGIRLYPLQTLDIRLHEVKLGLSQFEASFTEAFKDLSQASLVILHCLGGVDNIINIRYQHASFPFGNVFVARAFARWKVVEALHMLYSNKPNSQAKAVL